MRYILIASVIISLGCNNKGNRTENYKDQKHRDSTFSFIMKKFSLPYHSTSILDSNSLVFYNTRTFDTSFLLYINQRDNEIDGVYYEILPNYHNNVNSFAIEKNQLLFFNGYSFTIDRYQWSEVKLMANEILNNDSKFYINAGCRGCEEFALFFNYKSNKVNYENDSKYRFFISYVRNLFLAEFVEQRQPIYTR